MNTIDPKGEEKREQIATICAKFVSTRFIRIHNEYYWNMVQELEQYVSDREQRLFDKFEALIGEDEQEYEKLNPAIGAIARNSLRQNLRQKLAEMRKGEV